MVARLLTIAVVLGLTLCACADDKPRFKGPPAKEKAADPLNDARLAEWKFAGKVYAELVKSRPGENIIFSPFGAFESLAMLEVGARGHTAESLRSLAGPGRDWAPALATMRQSGGQWAFAKTWPDLLENGGYGLKVKSPLDPRSDLARSGLQSGDLIFTANHQAVRTVDEFATECNDAPARVALRGYRLESGYPFESLQLLRRPIPSANAKPENQLMNFARALWIKSDLARQSAYPAELQKLYGAKTFTFEGVLSPNDPRASEFVKAETGGRIPRMTFGKLPDGLKLLQVNVLAMNALWEEAFSEFATRPGEFQTPRGPVKADFMENTSQYWFADLSDALILDLPYRGSDLYLRVYLPKDPARLSELEEMVTAERWFDRESTFYLKRQAVRVRLPKFRVEMAESLKPALQALGLTGPFTKGADLRGIDPANNLMVDDIRQQAFLEIDEYGTRAGAITEISEQPKGIGPGVPFFDARHPFVFAVRDSAGTIFLMGRVMKPLPPKRRANEAKNK